MFMHNKLDMKTCGRCGKTFECYANTGDCWCMKLPPLPNPLPDKDCICASCLEKEIQAQQGPLNP